MSGHSLATAIAIRNLLDRAGYTETSIRELLKTPEFPSRRPLIDNREIFLWRSRGDTPLAVLTRLFLLNQSVPPAEVRRAVEPTSLGTWAAAGLLSFTSDEVRPEYQLTPFEGLVLASDWPAPDVTEPVMGLAATSRMLARLMVRRPSRRTLDLGTGCGVLAHLAARHSDRICATDMNPRALHLARINAELNDLSGIEFLQGNWFEPVRNQTFDLIVCNSPFVMSPARECLHSHSDRPTDQLCRDLVRSAPGFLNEGGFFQLTASWAQISGEDWHSRLAEWFAGSGCDAWVLHGEVEDPAFFAHQSLADSAETSDPSGRRFADWMAYYEREWIVGIGTGLITLRRSARDSNWIRFDRFPGASESGEKSVEAGFAVRDFLEANAGNGALWGVRLRHAPHLRWERRHELSTSGWTEVESHLRKTAGLGFVGNVDTEVAEFVARCRGEKTLAVHLAELAAETGRSADQIAPGFLRVVRRFVELGFLEPVLDGAL